MTVQNIFDNALSLTGFCESPLFDDSEIKSHMLSIVNAVYSEVFYIKNKDGFVPVSSGKDEIELGEREINDCILYGVATFIVNILGNEHDYAVFSALYNHKKAALERSCQTKHIKDALPKGCDF